MSIQNERLDLQRFSEEAAPAAVAAPAGPDNFAASEQPAAAEPAAPSGPAAAPSADDPTPNAQGEPADDRARFLAAKRGREVRGIWQNWLRESGEMQRIYPDFDLAAELNDPDFVRLLHSGVSMRTAYQARHLDALLGGAMQYAARRAAENAAAQWASRPARPAENGTHPHTGAVLHTSVAKLTPAQRAAMERRAVKGERITL